VIHIKEPSVPKNENPWFGKYTAKHELLYLVTSDQLRTKYFLYQVVDGKLKKLHTSKYPVFAELDSS
jgi:hypothetical protein